MLYSEQTCRPEIDTEILTLGLTEQCNLQCIYCYQVERRNNTRNIMSFDVATAAIKDHLTRENSFKSVIIELIGGEVFLYWKFVKDIITWTIKNKNIWKKKFTFFIDTNGTLLNDEIKDWLRERCSYVIAGLSLDGTPEAQNINRSGSYDRIAPHLQFFAETWPQQPVKMTISPNTIHLIFDGIMHCMSNGLLVAANLPLENIWGSSDQKKTYVSKFKQEIEKLVNFFGKNTELPLPALIDLPIYNTAFKDRNKTWCGAGRNMCSIERDGTLLPCNRFSKMSFDQKLFKKKLTPEVNKCHYCMFKLACQTCEAHNWEVNGNPNERTTFHCEFTKLQVWGTAQVHSMRFEKRLKEILAMSKEEQIKYSEELVKIKRALYIIERILEQFEKYNSLTNIAIGLDRSLGSEDYWKNRSLDPEYRWSKIYPNSPYPDKSIIGNC